MTLKTIFKNPWKPEILIDPQLSGPVTKQLTDQ